MQTRWPSMIKADALGYRGGGASFDGGASFGDLPEEIRVLILLVASKVDESIEFATNASSSEDAIRKLCESMESIVEYLTTLNRLSKQYKLNRESKRFVKAKLTSIVAKIQTFVASTTWLTENATATIDKTLDTCRKIDALIEASRTPVPLSRQNAYHPEQWEALLGSSS